MTVDTAIRPGTGTTVAAFSKVEVVAKLRELLITAAEADAALKGFTLPATLAGQVSAIVQLDSLEVVSLLCDIEPIVGFELKGSLVRAGGYQSVDQALEHLMPRIELAWDKHGKRAQRYG